MVLSVNKTLAVSPWELVILLSKAGVIDASPCSPHVQIVEKTEVNQGRTILIHWSVMDESKEA